MALKARNDLRSAEALISTRDYADDVVGFLLQQAVEKSLKSVIAGSEREVPRTHDLEELVQLVEDSGRELPATLASSSWLTPWAVDFRYEEPEVPLDADGALNAAKTAIGVAESALSDGESRSTE
jgi:HEPN domain-containing protein